jgi:hypothetical protein
MAERITGDMEAMPANATSEIDYSIVVPVTSLKGIGRGYEIPEA